MQTEPTQRDLQINVAIGWLGLTLALAMVITSTLVKAAIETDFSGIVHHPGPQGWAVFCVQFFLYVSLAVISTQISAGWFRWLNTGLLALVTLYMLAHQVGHAREGVVYGLTGMVDAAHHLIGIVSTWQALRWARAGAAARSANPSLDKAVNC